MIGRPQKWIRLLKTAGRILFVIVLLENMLLLLKLQMNNKFHSNQSDVTTSEVSPETPRMATSAAPNSTVLRTTTLSSVGKTKKVVVPHAPAPIKPVPMSPAERERRRIEQMEKQYYKRRPVKVNVYKYNYLIEAGHICTEDTFAMVIVHSLHNYIQRRMSIRATWGSIGKGGAWPYGPGIKKKIRLAFIMGKHKNKTWNDYIQRESETYSDIIQGDFIDAYSNMTLKSLLGLRWMIEHCKNASHLIKSDDDMFLNFPYLISTLQKKGKDMERGIMGPYNHRSRVYRSGKWGVSQKLFPMPWYPPYESGAAYVISNRIIKELYETAEYIPPIHVDDAYITGILAKVIGAKHVLVYGFAYWSTPRPSICDFVRNRLLTGTKMLPNILRQMWQGMKKPNCPS